MLFAFGKFSAKLQSNLSENMVFKRVPSSDVQLSYATTVRFANKPMIPNLKGGRIYMTEHNHLLIFI